jgi:hypothetical protein
LDNVYVADWSNNRIQKFSSSGTFITKWGSIGSGNTEFDHPTGVTTDSSDNVYVSDQNNARIAKFSSSGTFITKWGSSGSGNGQFSIPQDVATDSSDNVYVADYGNDRIQKFSSSGTFLAKTGSAGSGDGQFDSPSGVAIDSADNIYVTDSFNYRIQKFFKAPQTQIDSGPSGLTNDSTPTFGFSSDTPGSTFECRLDSNQEADFQLCTSPQSYGLLTDGTHTFEVRATDQAGNTDPTPASRTFTVDTTPPTVTAPVQSLVLGNQISNSSSSVPVRLRWSGSDDRTSLSNLKFDVNGRIYRSGSWGAWSPVLADTSLRATTRYLIPDKKYQYEARSKDQAGNVSAFKAGPGFTPRLLQESAATYTGTWSTEAQSDASGGSVKTSSQAGATASFAFTERNVGVVMPLRSTLGSVKICLDPGTASESCSTVDLSPSSGLGARKIVFARNGLSTAVQHRVKITVLSGRADLDALAVLG